MGRIIDKSFFTAQAEDLAQQLLGKILCHKTPNAEHTIRFRITVTEAYPSDDEVSYSKKYTEGKAVDFLTDNIGLCCIFGGMILISCGEKNSNNRCHDNVLIRGGYNIANEEDENYHDKGKGQPSKFAEGLRLKSDLPVMNLLEENGSLWIEEDDTPEILASAEPRINVSEEKRLRFSLQI